MTIEELKHRKQELGFSNETVAARSGVPLGTVQKFFGGATKHPRQETIQAITDALYPEHGYLRTTEGRYRVSYDDLEWADKPVRRDIFIGAEGAGLLLREKPQAYGSSTARKMEKKTVEDYRALPENVRAELIDGEFYWMDAPSPVHQAILLQLAIQFQSCVDAHPSSCRVFIAPFDVQLDQDAFTMLQPDLLVICDDEKLTNWGYFGAPDLVIEILSPLTKKKDLTIKLRKYIGAGVREYWIVDPKTERVVVYRLEDPDLPQICNYEDPVPIGISDGECSIEFTKIWDSVRSLRRDS